MRVPQTSQASITWTTVRSLPTLLKWSPLWSSIAVWATLPLPAHMPLLRRAWSLGSGWTPTHKGLTVRHVCLPMPPTNLFQKYAVALNCNVSAMRCIVMCEVHHPSPLGKGIGTSSHSLTMPLATWSLTSCVTRQRLSALTRLLKPGHWHSSFALPSRFSTLITVGNLSGAFNKRLVAVGIVQQLMVHDTLQLNSVAK